MLAVLESTVGRDSGSPAVMFMSGNFASYDV